MIGQLQWTVTLGGLIFRLAPKIGHLERLKRLYGHLSKTKHCAIRYRAKETNNSPQPDKNMIGQELSMEMSKKKSQKTFPNH